MSGDESGLVACDFLAVGIASFGQLGRTDDVKEAIAKDEDRVTLRTANDTGQGHRSCFSDLDVGIAEQGAEQIEQLKRLILFDDRELLEEEDCASQS